MSELAPFDLSTDEPDFRNDVAAVIERLAARSSPLPEAAAADLNRWFARAQAAVRLGTWRLDQPLRQQIAELYRRPPAGWSGSHHLLVLLATDQAPASLKSWVELVLDRPPEADLQAGEVFAPLLWRAGWDTGSVFPALLAGLEHRTIAPLALDLANFLVRRGLVRQHPASSRTAHLSRLLSQLAEGLDLLDEDVARDVAPRGVGRQIADSTALAICCIDALALIGDRQAIPSLFKALGVEHRRLQVEAAYALARFKEPAGQEKLLELAAAPVVRLRTLAYASELGLLDQIPAEMRSAMRRAEAELIQWLTEPTQFGIPPDTCQLVDQRPWNWPGFEARIEAFLFEFSYAGLAGASGGYVNRAIVGPMVRAPRSDLLPLSSADTYAYFAGWQTDHAEIREVRCAEFGPIDQHHAERLLRSIPADIELQSVLWLSYFFEAVHLVCGAQRSQTEAPPVFGTLVLADAGTAWFPHQASPRALDARDWYDVFKGRRLLETFNRSSPHRS